MIKTNDVPDVDIPDVLMSSSPTHKPYLTTREAAERLGVSLRTVQLWSENGLLAAWKTAGGHRRVSLESIERLLLERGGAAMANTPPLQHEPSTVHILVADDDPVFREIYRTVLGGWSLRPELSFSTDGFDILIRLGLERPDLLITDLDMPGMDGFEMLRRLKAIPDMAGLNIIVVTGLQEAEIRQRNGLPAGIPVLFKPVDFARLEQMVRGLLAMPAVGKSGKD